MHQSPSFSQKVDSPFALQQHSSFRITRSRDRVWLRPSAKEMRHKVRHKMRTKTSTGPNRRNDTSALWSQISQHRSTRSMYQSTQWINNSSANTNRTSAILFSPFHGLALRSKEGRPSSERPSAEKRRNSSYVRELSSRRLPGHAYAAAEVPARENPSGVRLAVNGCFFFLLFLFADAVRDRFSLARLIQYNVSQFEVKFGAPITRQYARVAWHPLSGRLR